MKFLVSDCKSIEQAEIVIAGVNDYSGSHSVREMSANGPDAIRKVFNERSIIKRKGKTGLIEAQGTVFNKKVFDAGNIRREEVKGFAAKLAAAKKIPVILGGDHSITFEAFKGFAAAKKKGIRMLYFDSHPDIISSHRNYYGSVLADIIDLGIVDAKKSLIVGMRGPEAREGELRNLKKYGMNYITSNWVAENGILKTVDRIKRTVRKGNIYLSVDLDVADPAFAPAVSTPIPGGLTSNELIAIANKIAKLGLIGFDIMEMSPKYDINEMTADLAGRLMLEVIANI